MLVNERVPCLEVDIVKLFRHEVLRLSLVVHDWELGALDWARGLLGLIKVVLGEGLLGAEIAGLRDGRDRQ